MRSQKPEARSQMGVQAFELLVFICLLFTAGTAGAQEKPVRPASDAEAAAGADVRAYETPRQIMTYGGGGGGPTNGQTAAQVGALIQKTNDAFAGVIGTNGTPGTFKFSTTGTNAVANIATNLPGFGGSTPSGLVTNNAPQDIVVTNAGVNTRITSNSVTTATLNATTGNMATANVTNANFPTLTPAAGHTNALTVLPTGALSTNDIANSGSGAAQTPWTGPIDADSNGVARVGYIGFTNNASANTSSLLQSNYNSSSYGSTLALTGKTNGVASQSAYSADNGVFGTVYAGGGNVSIIPTNGAGVNALSNTLTTLPLGITNNTGQRVQPVVQVRWFNDGAGAMILTASNETTGMKLIFGEPASASLGFSYTNWFNLPITSTNDVWRMRNESQNTSSANVMNQWFIGL
jgi:hypothetical protein